MPRELQYKQILTLELVLVHNLLQVISHIDKLFSKNTVSVAAEQLERTKGMLTPGQCEGTLGMPLPRLSTSRPSWTRARSKRIRKRMRQSLTAKFDASPVSVDKNGRSPSRDCILLG